MFQTDGAKNASGGRRQKCLRWTAKNIGGGLLSGVTFDFFQRLRRPIFNVNPLSNVPKVKKKIPPAADQNVTFYACLEAPRRQA